MKTLKPILYSPGCNANYGHNDERIGRYFQVESLELENTVSQMKIYTGWD